MSDAIPKRIFRAARKVYRLQRDRSILRRLGSADDPYARRFANVLEQLKSGEQSADLARIEEWRASALAREEPLADGSLGPPGIFDADKTVRDVCRVSKPPRPALLMYLLVREFKPKQILELGTNIGVSCAYQAVALKENGSGNILTLEASPYRLRLARGLHAKLGLANVTYVKGLFEQTLEPALNSIGPVDFAFIDGNHQYRPTLDYCELVLKHAAPNVILVFDDIRWSQGMKDAWRELNSDRRFRLVLDLNEVGICLVTDGANVPTHAFPTIYYALA